MEEKMKTLFDLFNLELGMELEKENKVPEQIESFINSQDKSAKKAKELLENQGYINNAFKMCEIKNYFAERINHTLFTYYLGLILCKFNNLKERIEEKYKDYFEEEEEEDIFLKIWTITAVCHDYGYGYLNKIREEKIEIKTFDDIEVDNNIFNYNETEEELRYSKELIVNYFNEFARNKKEEDEFLEHGILGGYKLFDELLKNMYVDEQIKVFQDACYRIMEHDIWKITDSNKEDYFFKDFNKELINEVYKENFRIISEEEPLLYLLSLCDTIEFVKKIEDLNKDDGKRGKNITTYMKKIRISINKEHICIDVSEMKNELSKDNKETFEKWKNGIVGLKDWVNINSEGNENNIIKLTVNNHNVGLQKEVVG